MSAGPGCGGLPEQRLGDAVQVDAASHPCHAALFPVYAHALPTCTHPRTPTQELYPGTFHPTPTHHFLKLLAERGLLLRCYTQNIDSLEVAAGLPPDLVIPAHGNFDSASCVACGRSYDPAYVREALFGQADGSVAIPRCSSKVGVGRGVTGRLASLEPEEVLVGVDAASGEGECSGWGRPKAWCASVLLPLRAPAAGVNPPGPHASNHGAFHEHPSTHTHMRRGARAS